MKSRIGEAIINDVEVFSLDFSCLDSVDLVPVVFEAIEKLKFVNKKTVFLLNVTGCNFDKTAVNNLKGVGKEIQKFVEKSAIVGLSHHQTVLFGMYLRFTNSNLKRFDTIEKAMKYLV